jgi:hypothetical protein
MRKLLLFCAATFLAQAAFVQASAQTATTQTAQGDAARPARQRVVGEVTAVDSSAGGLTVRTDAGETVGVTTDDKTTIRRLPPGETSLDKATAATFADVRAGDRVLAVGVGSSGGVARQLILTTRAAAGAQGRDDGRRLLGRVVSVDASKKLIVVQTRGRGEGTESVNVEVLNGAKLLHYAPDSSRIADAQPMSFADIRVGDQLRATGERTSEGTGFRAEEIVAGSFTRVAGQVVSVDAARGELTLKNEQTGQTFRVHVGQRTTLRRVTPEFIKTMNERAEQMRAQREARRAEGGAQSANGNGESRGGRREGEGGGAAREGGRGEGGGREGRGGGGGGRRGGGGGFGGAGGGQMFDSLPTITLAELKKGDGVMITATPGADASSVTAVSIVTGDAEFIRRMQQRGGEGRQRGMSPGLPGDVIGGGTGGNREPPR